MFGVDDAVIAAGISAAGSAYAAHQANSANMQINAQTERQAWDMYHGTQAYNSVEANQMRSFNSAEAAAARDFNAAQGQVGRDFAADQSQLTAWRNAQEAQKQRDWSTHMTRNQYQFAVDDMKAAGLNPMLAYTKGGSTGPSGASASSSPASSGGVSGPAASGGAASSPGGNVPSRIGMLPANLGSASQVMQTMLNAKRQEAEIDNINADTAAKASQVPQNMQQTRKMEAEVENIVAMRPKIEAEINNIKSDTFKKQVETEVSAAYQRLLSTQEQHEQGKIGLTAVQKAKVDVETLLARYGLAEAQAGSKLWTDLGEGGSAANWAARLGQMLKSISK